MTKRKSADALRKESEAAAIAETEAVMPHVEPLTDAAALRRAADERALSRHAVRVGS